MANYIPSTQQLLIAGKNGVSNSAGINMYWGAYEPRVGLTWKVLGSDKTVLRLGFGIYHDSSWNQGAQGLWQNPPNLGESDQFPATFSAGCAFAYSYCASIPEEQTVESATHHHLRRLFLLCPFLSAAECGQSFSRQCVLLPAGELPARQGSPI